jgi:hypothetical protein
MIVSATWGLPSDYDVYVERLDPATNAWQERGCECSFVNNGEEVTVFAPEPGSWRVRVENFLAAPQEVDGEIEFVTDPAPPAAPESRYTPKQFNRYSGAMAEFAGRGGNVVLTDGAIQGLTALATGITADEITGGSFYAGWMDFDDGRGATYDVHHLAEDVNKEGTAEGKSVRSHLHGLSAVRESRGLEAALQQLRHCGAFGQGRRSATRWFLKPLDAGLPLTFGPSSVPRVTRKEAKGVGEDLGHSVEALLYSLGAPRQVEDETGAGRSGNSA